MMIFLDNDPNSGTLRDENGNKTADRDEGRTSYPAIFSGDANLNGTKDPGEKKVYFEVSDYSTSYVFYENPD
jgi:hypothetical protein